jgi:hypothetical protein
MCCMVTASAAPNRLSMRCQIVYIWLPIRPYMAFQLHTWGSKRSHNVPTVGSRSDIRAMLGGHRVLPQSSQGDQNWHFVPVLAPKRDQNWHFVPVLVLLDQNWHFVPVLVPSRAQNWHKVPVSVPLIL